MNKTIIIMLVLLITACSNYSSEIIFASAVGELPYGPDCEYSQLPPIGWYESFDQGNRQRYCVTDEGYLYGFQNLLRNDYGQYYTATNPDMWTIVDYEQPTGNIRNVRIEFEYYAGSISGSCPHSQTNPDNGLYNMEQIVLITNKESNLSTEGTFDDSFIQFNDQIVCDEWRQFNMTVSQFTNDFGSSFSGQSKSIGSIGFETKGLYLRNIRVVGVTTEVVW